MELTNKGLNRLSKTVFYSTSIILCYFLISLSNKIMMDIGNVVAPLHVTQFENTQELDILSQNKKQIEVLQEQLETQKNAIEQNITTATANYISEKKSFDNWLQTRKILGTPDKDFEVIKRAKKLDELYTIEKEWKEKLQIINNELSDGIKEYKVLEVAIEKEKELAYEKYYTALQYYDLKVFLVRLLIAGPILGLGIFFSIRFRKSKFWPLYFGFILFSLYVFFFGLVPYLPSYGGYVRYGTGILLSIGIGYYVIKKINQFIEKKQIELKDSAQERAKKIQGVIAEKALDNHCCPSCRKDFLLKSWDFTTQENKNRVSNFCRYCGLELFKDCQRCHVKNFIHLPHCAECGLKIGE